MSLEKLLKEEEKSSRWREQKKRLTRIFFGLSIIAISLIGALIYFLTIREDKSTKEVASVSEQEQKSESLSQLMRLKEEANNLQEDIKQLRNTANSSNQHRSVSQVPQRVQYVQRTNNKSPRIINFDPGDGFVSVSAKRKDLYIPTGAIFRASLLTPIKTSLQETFVMAETTSEFRMNMNKKIPKGSRLIGTARLNPVLKSVIVEFNTLVLPKGIETSFNGLALSRNALPELEGLYFSDQLQRYGTALAFGFLGGLSDASREREGTVFGSQPEEGLTNDLLAGVSAASFQVAEQMLEDIREKAVEYVVVPAGKPVFIVLTRKYDLTQEGMEQ